MGGVAVACDGDRYAQGWIHAANGMAVSDSVSVYGTVQLPKFFSSLQTQKAPSSLDRSGLLDCRFSVQKTGWSPAFMQ